MGILIPFRPPYIDRYSIHSVFIVGLHGHMIIPNCCDPDVKPVFIISYHIGDPPHHKLMWIITDGDGWAKGIGSSVFFDTSPVNIEITPEDRCLRREDVEKILRYHLVLHSE